MPDNFTYDEIMEQLIRYVDGELHEDEKFAIEKLIHQDNAVQERYENLLASREAIKMLGLRNRIQVLHNEYETSKVKSEDEGKSRAKVIGLSFAKKYKMLLRIAAALLVAVASYGIYEYSTISSERLYAENFISYNLPVTRGDGINNTTIDSFYASKNYVGVVNTFESATSKTQRDYFIAGLSFLELNKTTDAIDAFSKLQQLNSNGTEKHYKDETEYYLLLAYIKANRAEDALKMLDIITANKQHLYYQKANEISRTKLMFLKWKE